MKKNWYSKYLSIYEKSFNEISDPITTEIKKKIELINKCKESPIASIVIIAHNEETRIASCLWSLCDNICDYPFEIIVIDNNSKDNTTTVLDKLNVRWYEEKKKGPGHARNCGLDHAQGKFYLCIDADSIYPPHYIEQTIKALQEKNVICSYGLWSFIPSANYPYWQLVIYEKMRDIYLRIQNIKRPELCVRGMVFAFHTKQGKNIRFRTDIIRGEDGSMALAMKKYGKLKFITKKETRVITGLGTLKNDGSLLQSFFKRLQKGFLGIISLFHSKNSYKDKESNMIK